MKKTISLPNTKYLLVDIIECLDVCQVGPLSWSTQLNFVHSRDHRSPTIWNNYENDDIMM